MSRAGVTGATQAATLPPSDLDGLDPAFSRLVQVPDASANGATRVWHILDNGPRLSELGVEPVGTILCVHGNPTWSYLWRKMLATATESGPAWRVIAPDQLEMGFSERTGTYRPLARRVQDLADLTAALGVDGPVITLGHDWGGVISLGWAVDHQQSLAGVMLLNTAVHQPEDAKIPAPLRLALHSAVLERSTVTTPAFLETTLALAHPPLRATVKNGYRAPYRRAERRGGIGAFVADIPAGPEHPSAAELDRIAAGVAQLNVPALMLWGPRDPIFSDRYLNDLLTRLPHAQVHRFEGAGHLVAEDVNYPAAVLSWLQQAVPMTATSPARVPASPAVTPAQPPQPALAHKPAQAAPTHPASQPPPSSVPLWRYLDTLRDDDRTALVEMAPATGPAPRNVSWRLLSTRVRQLASGLARIGVKKGHRVSLLVPPGADLTAALYACLRLGAIVVVADAGLGLRGLTRAVSGAWPDYVIGGTPGLAAARALGWPGEKISVSQLSGPARAALGVRHSIPSLLRLGADEVLPAAPEPAETAAVLFTSGSTGPAKGVVYTHAQLGAIRDCLATQYRVGVGTGLVAGFAPFALLGPALGARSATPNMSVTAPKRLTASSVAAAAAEVDATVVFLSPAALKNVVATAGDLTAADQPALNRVQLVLSAGAPVPTALLDAVSTILPQAEAHSPYGMTEGLLITDISLAEIHGLEDAEQEGICVGSPVPAATVRISALDDAGNATGALSSSSGITGEVVVSAAHLKNHYDRLWLTDQAATAGTPAGEHWHRTGDVGHFDADGRLWIEGRLPHVMVTATGVVTPVGAEQRMDALPAVDRSALVGAGPRGAQQLVAIVETLPAARRPGLASGEVAASVRAAAGSLPAGACAAPALAAVLVVPALPTDVRHNSKIDRSRLARWAEDVLSGSRMVQP